MFEYLNKYQHNGKFLFKYDQDLEEKCKDVPRDKSGVYFVTTLTQNPNDAELLYVGCSGKKNFATGEIIHRESSGGGLYGRLAGGKQFGEYRKISWPKKMIEEGIDYLKVYWFDTGNDNPEGVESLLLNEFYDTFGGLPRWNNELPPKGILL